MRTPLYDVNARRKAALPLIEHGGRSYAVALPLISTLPRAQLRQAEGSLAPYRDNISRALDWLLFGF